MRRTVAVLHAQHPLPLPRGWIVLIAALLGWAFVVGLTASTGALFNWLLSTI